MWIILEGVDGSGKTTLLAEIVNQLTGLARPFKVGHLGPPEAPETAIDECIKGSGIDPEDPDRIYRPGGWHLVSDRLHMGCPVYGPLYRPDVDVDGYGDFGIAGWRYIELYLSSRGAVTFLALVSPDTAIERVRRRNSENHFSVESIIETLPTLIDRYEWLASDTMTLGPRVFEPHMEEIEDWANMMIAIAKAREDVVKDLAQFEDYIGPPNPGTLIICEPIRDTRLEVLAAVDDSVWQDIGFCSSARTHQDLEKLVEILDYPHVVGINELPTEAGQFVFNVDGKFVDDPVAAAAACTR